MKYSCFTAVLPSPLYVKSQNRMKLSMVTTVIFRNSQRPHGLCSDQLFAFWIPLFDLYTHYHSSEGQISTVNLYDIIHKSSYIIYFYPSVCCLILFFRLKKISEEQNYELFSSRGLRGVVLRSNLLFFVISLV